MYILYIKNIWINIEKQTWVSPKSEGTCTDALAADASCFVTCGAPATTNTPHTSFDLLHICRPRNLQSFRTSSGQVRTNVASSQNSPNIGKHWERAAEHPKTSSKHRTLICYMPFRKLAILLCFKRSSYDLPWGWKLWSKCCYSDEPAAFYVSLIITYDMGGREGMHSIDCRRKHIDPTTPHPI